MKRLKKRLWMIATAAAALLGLALAFALIDLPPQAVYTVTQGQGQNLRVTLQVKAPLFYQAGPAVFYTPQGGALEFPLARCKTAQYTYTVPLAALGKHGHQGLVTQEYLVFDGAQAFLQPATDVSRIRLVFDLPGPAAIGPSGEINKPDWIDIYALRQNAYAFGNFSRVDQYGALAVYALSGAAEPGIRALYDYYAQLFACRPGLVVILLPPGDDVIGGAGRDCIAASFDRDAPRDWQLLSHRMFHAFFDAAISEPSYRAPPNLWLLEGLASYYETISLDEPERQLAVLYAQYLYMREKYPEAFRLAPMQEAEFLDLPAQTEFLHYTAAPLLVAALEQLSQNEGNAPNSLLRFILSAESPPGGLPASEALAALLGESGKQFYRDHCLGTDPPPLGFLEEFMPAGEKLERAQEEIENVLDSWMG